MQNIFGVHTCLEKIKTSPGTIHRMYLKKSLNFKVLNEFIELAKQNRVPYKMVEERELNKLLKSKDANHQGVVIVQNEITPVDLKDFLKNLGDKNGLLVLMHELNDPYNVGAIIRSAGAFGALGVIVPMRNQSPLNEIVAKTSSGVLYKIPIIRVNNLNQAVLKLKESGFWIYGLTEKATNSVYEANFDKRSVIIIGNEHTGISREVLNKCDFQIRIPIQDVDSLNASVSAGIALYEWNKTQS